MAASCYVFLFIVFLLYGAELPGKNIDVYNIRYLKKTFGQLIAFISYKSQHDNGTTLKVSKETRIRNRYNYIPHLTQDTT